MATHFARIAKYERYSQEATAIVQKVETRRVRSGKHRRREYRVAYAYYVDDEPYQRTSYWMSGSPYLREGQDLAMRFDPEDPADSILEIEKNNSVSWVAALVVTCSVVGAMYKLGIGKYKKKR